MTAAKAALGSNTDNGIDRDFMQGTNERHLIAENQTELSA